MRILILAPDQHHRYNRGHQLFRDEIARQHEVIFYGADAFAEQRKDDLLYGYHVPDLISEFGEFDAVMVEGPRYAGYFTGMDQVKALKFTRLVDFIPRHIVKYLPFIEKMNFDVCFGSTIGIAFFKAMPEGKIKKSIKTILLPFSVDTAVYRKMYFKKTTDVAVIGSETSWAYPQRKAMRIMIENLPEPIRTLTGGARRKSRILHGDYVRAINRTKIFVVANSIYNTVSMKYFECMACGTFLLAEKPREMEDLGFVEGIHMGLFDGVEDLKDKIFYYLAHEAERERIAVTGMEHVRVRHSDEVRVRQMTAGLESEMRCHVCGNKAILYDTDPYDDEFPDLMDEGSINEAEWWCDDCYQERLDAI